MDETLYELFDVPLRENDVVGVKVNVMIDPGSGKLVPRSVTVNALPGDTIESVIESAVEYAIHAIASGLWQTDSGGVIVQAGIVGVALGGYESPGVGVEPIGG